MVDTAEDRTLDNVLLIISWYAHLLPPAYCGVMTKCACVKSQGSAFIGYGTILAIVLLAGEAWIKRTGRSQEWWDSCVITAWVRMLCF